MTVNEAILEMRSSGVLEEDIEAIIEVCKTKGLKPQIIDQELEKRGLEKVFELEYDTSENWLDTTSGASLHKPSGKVTTEKEKN